MMRKMSRIYASCGFSSHSLDEMDDYDSQVRGFKNATLDHSMYVTATATAVTAVAICTATSKCI